MTQNFIIHIGPHKTGTTSIQNMLYARSLQSGASFVYPFAHANQTGQHEFARTASDPDHSKLGGLLEILSGLEKTCVLSSEELSFLPVASLQKIRAALPSSEFTIVYYQRNILSLLPSWWQELIKHGGVEDFTSFIQDAIALPGRLHLLVPDLLLSNWASVFGRSAIKIFLYDQIPDVAQQFASDLLGLTSLPGERTDNNKSFEYIECEMIRQWNAYGFVGIDAIQAQESKFLRTLVAERADRFMKNMTIGYDIGEFLSIESTLIARWGDRIEGFTGGKLFALRERAYSYINSDFWTANPDLVSAMFAFAEVTARRKSQSSATSPILRDLRSCERDMDAWNQIEIILAAARQREQLLERQLANQTERSHALEIVISTLVSSITWRGLNRSKFKKILTDVAKSTPSDGATAHRHEVYLYQAQKLLNDC